MHKCMRFNYELKLLVVTFPSSVQVKSLLLLHPVTSLRSRRCSCYAAAPVIHLQNGKNVTIRFHAIITFRSTCTCYKPKHSASGLYRNFYFSIHFISVFQHFGVIRISFVSYVVCPKFYLCLK